MLLSLRWFPCYGSQTNKKGFGGILIRCHDFRGTFCTMCYEADVPIKTLQKWMGHTDPTVLMKFYAKLTEEKELYDTTKLNDITKKRFES